MVIPENTREFAFGYTRPRGKGERDVLREDPLGVVPSRIGENDEAFTSNTTEALVLEPVRGVL